MTPSTAPQISGRSMGIPATIGSCSAIYREAAFADWPEDKHLPNAKRLHETNLCLQVHPTLEEEHMHAVGEAVAKAVTAR